GQGVKVGIVDSGIDYTHSALGGCFGAGCKVAYGYDFVSDAYTGASWPSTGWQAVPDTDPRDVCNGHGTHVAGLVAASSSEVTGAAPAATLGAYRVLGCTGGVGIDVLISAL
ncbi:peptidase S8/S53 domain-containing protein, partial [Syncephalis plumigaleata]